MEAAGFRRVFTGLETSLLNLRNSTESLRSGLKKSWRYDLKQAEKQIAEVEAGLPLDQLLLLHEADREAKSYRSGEDAYLVYLSALCRSFYLCDAGEPVAAILMMRHGRAATYQLAWTSPRGRELRATHRLLWQAILTLRDDGVEWLDLGAMNAGKADGVRHFKNGLGGLDWPLSGTYV